MIKRNVYLKGKIKVSAWRKLSFGMWTGSSVPQVMAQVRFQLPITDSKETSAVFASAVSKAVSEFPQLNSSLRFNKFYERKAVDVFFHVAGSPDRDNLTGVVIRGAENKDVAEIRQELSQGARQIRNGEDPLFGGMKKTSWLVPSIFVVALTRFLNFIMYDLNLWIPLLGVGRDPFGSYMITNVGALGFDTALVPLPTFGSVPIIFCLGRFENGELPVSLSFDHRRMDGVMAAEFGQRIRYHLNSLTA